MLCYTIAFFPTIILQNIMTTPAIEHVQAVAFDLDGTLCDSVPDLAAAANATREFMGLPPLPAGVVESYVGDGLANLVHRILTDSRNGSAGQEEWEKAFDFYIRYYRSHLCDHTRLYPETEAGLGLLKTLGIPLVVITNKNEVLAAELLKQLGLADYFSLVLGGDSLAEKKPSPLPLLHAAEVLNIEPADMMMVGDSQNDILAAKAAGCLSVGVTFGYGDMTMLSQDDATKPDWIIGSLPEISREIIMAIPISQIKGLEKLDNASIIASFGLSAVTPVSATKVTEITAIAPMGNTLPIIAMIVPTNKANKCHALGATPSGTGMTNQISKVTAIAMTAGMGLNGIKFSFYVKPTTNPYVISLRPSLNPYKN